MANASSPITTHVLDTVTGRPAAGLSVQLFRQDGDQWTTIAQGETNSDGRITDWLAGQPRQAGIYRCDFATGTWMSAHQRTCFYPSVSITFALTAPDEHYHIPLLLSDFGYSTYRGS